MKLCIFGAGAIGGHLAAKLARAGQDVSLVARGPHVAAIRTSGLRLITPSEDFRVDVRATDDVAEIPKQDVVVTTVKAYSLPAAVDALRSLCHADTAIVFVVNGIPWWYFHENGSGSPDRTIERLDPGARLWNEVGVHRAIGGVAYSSNEVVEPGTIENRSDNRFVFGEPGGQLSPRLEAIAEVFQAAGTGSETSRDIRAEIWRKLLGNMATAVLGCLTRSATNQIAEHEGLRDLYLRVRTEGIQIAAALGVHLDADDPNKALERMGKIRHRSSMLQDLEAGRRLEIDAQLLAAQDLARAAGVPTPTLDIMIVLLAALAERRQAAQ